MRRLTPQADPEDGNITIDGTIKLCEDLQVDPEDVVLLAVAYELKSPGVGQWSKKGWLDGWKELGSVCPVECACPMEPMLAQMRLDRDDADDRAATISEAGLRLGIFPESLQLHVRLCAKRRAAQSL